MPLTFSRPSNYVRAVTNTTTAPDPVQLIALAGSERPGTLRDVLTIYGRRIERTGMFALLAPEDAEAVALIKRFGGAGDKTPDGLDLLVSNLEKRVWSMRARLPSHDSGFLVRLDWG
ncbi:MAG: hypothetical protein JWR11_3131 [Mycobacterium sp.]|nr:hypothetical protein [Mycobacterium sp.]